MTTATSPLGCSAFCLRKESDLWIGRNLDVPFTDGYLLTNPRGLRKRSVVADDLSPMHWTSRWGSLTVNLLGAQFPMGGINECGLVVEHLWMPGTVYPDRRETGALLEFEWIQCMLDTCTCVHDVRTRSGQAAILPGRVEMHFLLADAAGNAALLEFRDGQPLVYAGSAFEPPVATNSWYDESVRHALGSAGDGRGRNAPLPSPAESLDRFARLAAALDNAAARDGSDAPDTTMRLLNSVAGETLLSAAYHPSSGSVIFKTCRNGEPRMLRTTDCDFAPSAPRRMLDIHARVDAMQAFDSQAIVSSMREVLAIGAEFLRLDAFQRQMIARQLEDPTER